jgi:hypothetical protein
VAAKRGIWLIISLIFIAVVISTAGLLVVSLVVGSEPQIGGNSTLVLRVSGNLEEIEPSGLVTSFSRSLPPRGRWSTRCARRRSIAA